MAGPRRSLKMSPENWARIDAIAEDLNATALTGSRAGLPSWRSMMYQIATGKLSVVPTVEAKEQVIQTALYITLIDKLLADTIKALNRLEVKPRSAGAKRHILARLRAVNAEHSQEV